MKFCFGNNEGWAYLLEVGIQGMAAGAMLTMIAQTILPEAYHHARNFSGPATLLGFLLAFAVKVW